MLGSIIKEDWRLPDNVVFICTVHILRLADMAQQMLATFLLFPTAVIPGSPSRL